MSNEIQIIDNIPCYEKLLKENAKQQKANNKSQPKGYVKSYTAIDKYGHVTGAQLNRTQLSRLIIYETLKRKNRLLPVCELFKEVSA